MKDTNHSPRFLFYCFSCCLLILVVACSSSPTAVTNPTPIPRATLTPTARVADLSTPLLTYTGHAYLGVIDVAWSPDGKRIASAGDDHTVQIWDAATGRHILTYRGHLARVYTVAWSPDGQRIAFGSQQGGTWHLYLMNADGSNMHLLTGMSGNKPP